MLIDSNKCVGCKACMVACPYDVRFLSDGKKSYFNNNPTPNEEKAHLSDHLGPVQKCNFCVDRLKKGLRPSCVEACPTDALMFGDLDDADGELRRTLSEPRVHFRLKEELGTRPSIFYLG